MILIQNGDMIIARDGVSGLVVDGSIFWADGQPRDDSQMEFAIRYTDTGAIIAEDKTATPVDFPDLEIGSHGLAVVLAQTALKCKGYYKGKIDGDFGKQTYDAVRKFRTDNYLSGETIIDHECYKYLFKE